MGYGITVPFEGVALGHHRRWYEELAALGYTDAWSSEVDGADAFTPLALAAAWTDRLRLGTAVVPAFTRGPALLAQSAAAMAEAAPGRFALGIGTSSEVVVERWNGIPFVDPCDRARDVLRFLRAALSGHKVDAEFGSFAVRGFRLSRPPDPPPPLLLGALRPRMLRLAGREADGAVLNWLSADDVARVVPEVGPGKEIVARIFVVPGQDAGDARALGRRMIAAYLNVPAYAAFHRWLGRGPLLEGMWSRWRAGERAAALEAIPDEVVDDLVLHGSPADIRSGVRRYVDNGVGTPVLALLGARGDRLSQAVRDLAPGGRAGP